MQKSFLSGVLFALVLVGLGKVLVPATNWLGILSASAIMLVYGAVAWFLFPRIPRQVFALATRFGLIAALFAGEHILEYIFLPNDNTRWGYVEFGGVFLLFFVAALLTSWRSKRLKDGIVAALVTSLIYSLVWVIIVLFMLHLFLGSARQEHVLRSEGAYDDFARSGLSDFTTFTMEDSLGAAFFHPILAPLFALILGTIGGFLGKWLSIGVAQQDRSKDDYE